MLFDLVTSTLAGIAMLMLSAPPLLYLWLGTDNDTLVTLAEHNTAAPGVLLQFRLWSLPIWPLVPIVLLAVSVILRRVWLRHLSRMASAS
jgi:hypothetical protein